MTLESRLKMILAHEFSGQRCFEACDIPTRIRIATLIAKLKKLPWPTSPVTLPMRQGR